MVIGRLLKARRHEEPRRGAFRRGGFAPRAEVHPLLPPWAQPGARREKRHETDPRELQDGEGVSGGHHHR